jgi:hypothetical protein
LQNSTKDSASLCYHNSIIISATIHLIRKIVFVRLLTLYYLLIRLKEGQRLSEFFKDHSFQLHPLAAIYQHLRNTQPEPIVEEQRPKKRANVNGSKKRKNKSKAWSGLQSMDV